MRGVPIAGPPAGGPRRSAETLLNLFLASFLFGKCVPKNAVKLIPLYSAGGQFQKKITEQQIVSLERAGLLLRIVRHRKGHINRAILCQRLSDGAILTLASLSGTAYSFVEHLDKGNRVWALMKFQELRQHGAFGG